MLFERVVSEGIAHLSYIIGDEGKAAVIDPRRDGEVYLDIAARSGCTITHIFETHRNEDYMIGSLALADRCKAEIYHGAAMDFAYGNAVHDGDSFRFGSLSLQVLETPGHTEESISLVVRDTAGGDVPLLVFSGDTVFAGDIARTDFFGVDRKQEMAEKIFDSIMRIFALGDGVIICPAHGAGSVCGGKIADRPFTTVGIEKSTNHLIRMGRQSFVSQRVTESPYKPPYFRTMEHFNRSGAPGVPLPAPRFLTPIELQTLRKCGCQVIDIRAPGGFAAGHIPGSLSIWRNGISSYAGWFLSYENPVVIIDDFNQNTGEIIRQLYRLGYDNVDGILAGGIGSWFKNGGEVGTFRTCTVYGLRERLEREEVFLLDVRDIRNRRDAGFIPGSHHTYLGELPGHLDMIPRDVPVIIYCDAGFKSATAASILAMHQYRDLTTVLGGMAAWERAGFPIGHEK
ncbi:MULTISPECIES: rhodanese-like domain-containing protein [unclassified Methanoregula]|uniref:MBL fold metallo-hydrolase n=1 Tax=unclassified Methanoregula TaxID=2649730 RepID=UPI0009D58129|nr:MULTISPECIES: MBL fold metallo-hydrolase [unclassified Methanoregula]OPX63485.1 MAG: molybdopterin biosynthesis protein MoeB [Methanoregula sp. PtaB.Bin085]OPY35228.1 MAG: molybdopterin biosynthesis protein MoeB [Methanoregula sp. PtaU1.Bin006]